MPPEAAIDWTQGGDGLAYQRCVACAHTFYFHRGFCPACGAQSPPTLASKGIGTVHAKTLVYRAPNAAFRAIVPYAIVLVDLDEGVRVMAHGDPGLEIGMLATCCVREIAGVRLPYFSMSPQGDMHAT